MKKKGGGVDKFLLSPFLKNCTQVSNLRALSLSNT